MSDDKSNNDSVWWIIILSVIGGIGFVFDKTILSGLQSPFLRCLVAPIAGVVIGIGLYLYVFVLALIQAVIPGLLEMVLATIRWFTRPSTVTLLGIIGLSGIGVSLLFKWISIPIAPYWASLAGIAAGSICGFILTRPIKAFQPDSFILQSMGGIPVSGGLAYWVANTLRVNLETLWIAITIISVVILVIRFIYEGQNNQGEIVSRTTHNQTSNLPPNLKQQFLTQVRDQIGADQYERLVKNIGEDGIINFMLENAKNRDR